jgi:hypothetical protein
MTLHLGVIVEGHGEVAAVPVLLRRFCDALCPSLDLRIVLRPQRVSRAKLVQTGEVERTVEIVARRLGSPRAILVLVDADDDCPATLGPDLLRRAANARPDIPVGVVLAKREFEAWFLAAIESLAGHRGLRPGLSPVDQPESVRDAKGALQRYMEPGRTYAERLDQPALAQWFDIQQARRADSFDKCCREVQRLFQRVAG